MTLYDTWMKTAFTPDGRSNEPVWRDYLPREQAVYESILTEKITLLEGTVKELAERFQLSPMYLVAFVDGMNDALPEPYDIKELTEDSPLRLEIDFEALFKKMVEYKAEHLYTLPEWDTVFDEEKQKALFKEQKSSRTVVKGTKIGANEPCPCGSGKKYKRCCGAR